MVREEEVGEGDGVMGIEGVEVQVGWLRMRGGNRAVLDGGADEAGARMRWVLGIWVRGLEDRRVAM